jgi:DNA primase
VHVEREALKFGVQRPALCGPVFDALGAESFVVPAHATVFGVIAACGGTGAAGQGREWTEKLIAAAPDDRVRGFVTQLAVEPLRAPRADGEPDVRYADAVLARVEELAISREIAMIKSRLQRMSPVAEPERYNRTFGDLIALEGRHRALLDRVPDSV